MTVSPAQADPFLGVIVGDRYRVLQQIGRGGMGAIYRVENIRLGREFALKRLAAPGLEREEALARFRREADAVARLRHPHVVEVIDWETAPDGSPCIIMELLEGHDLRAQLAASGPLPWPMLARVADHITSALATAHRSGIIHRDLKPQNIFLVDDGHGELRAKLLDFGVAKIRGEQGFTTGTNDAVLGTPAYMSPEQANAQLGDVGPATDVWAMGAVLYELATARVAFAAESPMSILYRICHGAPGPLLAARPDAPAAFVDAINRTLTRDPTLRIASMDDLRAQLAAGLGSFVTGGFSPRRHDRIPTPLPLPIVAAPTGAAAPGAETISATWKRATGEMAAVSDPPPPQARALRALAVAGAILALAGLSWYALQGEPAEPMSSAASGGTAQTDEASPGAPASPVAPTGPAGPSAPAAVAAEVAGASPSPPAPPVADASPPAGPPVQVTVAEPPRGLRLTLDDQVVPGTSLEVPLDGARHRVSISAPGHREKVVWIDQGSTSLTVRLERLPRPAKPPVAPDRRRPPGPLTP